MEHVLHSQPQEEPGSKGNLWVQEHHQPPAAEGVGPFEDNLFNLIYSIKYKPAHNKFQEQLKKDKLQIINNPKVIIGTDKTSNMYKMEADEYTKKVMESITKEYNKCSKSTVSEIIKDAATIACLHNLEDQIDATHPKRGLHHNQGPQEWVPWARGLPVDQPRQEPHWQHQ